jgi:hypothetical protein
MPQPFPKATDADLEIVLCYEPGLQLGKRRIGFAHDAGAKSFVVGGKLRLGAACPRTRARLSRSLPPIEKLIDIGHADPEDGRYGISTCSRIHRRHDTLAQVLRIGSPHHRSPHLESTVKENQKSRPIGIPTAIPSTMKTL